MDELYNVSPSSIVIYASSSFVNREGLVAGSYGLGSAIAESNGVDGCAEPRRFGFIDERQGDSITEYALSTTVACSRAVRA